MINFIVWIILGGVLGWIASMIMKTNAQQSLPMDIGFGVAGGFIASLVGLSGGIVMQLIGAVLGACLLIFGLRWFQSRSS